MILARSRHQQYVGELFVELWNVARYHEGRQPFHLLSIADVMSGDIIVQCVERNWVDDVMVVVLCSSQFHNTITILFVDAKVPQKERRRSSSIFVVILV